MKMTICLSILSLFLVFSSFADELRPAKHDRIAIVGAGPAGLVAAYELKKKGYENVVVFEKEASAGGKVKTLNIDNFRIELGAVITTLDYKVINELAKEFNVDLETLPSKLMVQKSNGVKVNFGAVTESGASEQLSAGFNFLKTLYRYPSIRRSGIANVHDEKIYSPMAEFAQQRGFTDIFLPFELSFVGCGYGFMDEVPAVYPLKLMSMIYKSGFKESLRKKVPGAASVLLPPHLQRVTIGFQRLWTRIAEELNVRVNSPVVSMKRTKLPSGRYEIKIQTPNGTDQFDHVIVATNPYATLKFLDASIREKEIFNKAHSYKYHITVFRSPDLDRNEMVFFEKNKARPRIGNIVALMNYYEESDIFVAYQLADWSTSEKELYSILQENVANMGGTISDVDLHHNWNYFPHFKSEDLKDGVAKRLEALQGINSTYYTGAILSFESTESVSRYSKDLIKRFF